MRDCSLKLNSSYGDIKIEVDISNYATNVNINK